MPLFQYQATNAVGQEVTDTIEAEAVDKAAAKIRTLGYFPTRITAKSAAKARATRAKGGKSLVIFPGRVSTATLTSFTQQLSILQDAGLPLVRSLHVLAQQERPGLLK